MTAISIRPAVGESDIAEVTRLFEEYAVWIGVDLSFQNFEAELKGLPGDYAAPGGALFLASVDARAAGCIGVRRIDESDCEMKRLFVRDAFRGLGAGVRLAEEAIAWARLHGYRRMLLDTLPSMGTAHKLYERLGFRKVPPYRFNPVEGAQFLALELRDR